MIPQVKEDIIKVLDHVIDILTVPEEKDVTELRDLSNRTVHNASVFQDEDSVSIAVLVYALSKVITRAGYHNNRMLELLSRARRFLLDDKFGKYTGSIKETFEVIKNLDKKIPLYVQEVINMAEIKKGSRLYEHGISMARASEILGVSQWELMNYVGKTTISDTKPSGIDVRQRVKHTIRLFAK